MDDVTPGWLFLHTGFEGDGIEVDDVRLWDATWVRTRARITVAHPQYPDQRHVMTTYETDGSANRVEFAADEFSNGVWGFFVPEAPAV